MGDQYIKKNGAWTKVTRPYVRRNNVWTPVKESWVKRSGVWTLSWFYDATPCSTPEISLQVVDNRMIRVGLRLPDVASDPRLKTIRVLALPDVSPTTQFGSGYIHGNSDGYPDEDWSKWWYNGNNPTVSVKAVRDHGNTNSFDYKYYPLNPTDKTNLPGNKYYYFAAWSEDIDGNWSVGVFTKIWMPKNGIPAGTFLKKEANIKANAAGTLTGAASAAVYAPGYVKAHDTPRNNGVWFYGTTFNDAVGAKGNPTVDAAKIRVSRANDTGLSVATVRLGWLNQATVGNLDPSTVNDETVVGTIQKGETKWFDLPTSWYTDFNTRLKAIVLRAGPSATDDVELNDLGTDARCGEVNISWKEDI